MNELHLFAGAGGGILGGQLLGHRTVCAVEWEPYAQAVLVARQNDGSLPPFPIWDDVQTFNGKPWRVVVDVVAGGFPCQDISVAGKGAGITGERSGMWTHMARIVGEVRPRFVFVENSPALITRGLGVVLSDLAALGYDCKWTVLGAADVGAPHQRDRLWILAHSVSQSGGREIHGDQAIRPQANRSSNGLGGSGDGGRAGHVAHANGVRELQPQGCQCNERAWIGDRCLCHASCPDVERQRHQPSGVGAEFSEIGDASWWATERGLDRVAHGVAHRVDRLKAIGNGQVPACAAMAWRTLGGP